MASFLAFFNIFLIIFFTYFPILGPSSPLFTNIFCQNFFNGGMIAISIFWVLFSITSLFTTSKNSPLFRRIYLILIFIELCLIFFFNSFAFEITRGSIEFSKVEDDTYKLSNYSKLNSNIVSYKNWESLKQCIRKEGICENLARRHRGMDYKDFRKEKLSHIELGCWKPPSCCGILYKNATNWVPGTKKSTEQDCEVWSNDEDKLCYNCESCKAGFMEEMKKPWRSLISLSISPFFWATMMQYLHTVTRTTGQ
ncbi:tetraspanin-7-like [Tasmannia lanceolata]|uniref:tetraspanin-7-like n=1 Tax=Tasmannia lanceolata TaxID=3420 RepID=UPI00406385AF